MDKSLALRLVDTIEKLYIENLGYKAIIQTNRAHLPTQSQIDWILEQGKTDPRIADTIRQQFEPIRIRIREDAGLEQAIQGLLQVVQPNKDVN